MLKAADIMGKPVIVREGGLQAGRVKDLVVDQSGRRILALIVAEGMLKGTKVAPWAELTAIGPDSVVLRGPGSVVSVKEVPEIKGALDSNTNIRGLKLQTIAGKALGKVEDFHFDEQTGAVVGYELSGGVLADKLGGRTFLPTPSTLMELGKDVVFVQPETEDTITQLTGGLKGIFSRDDAPEDRDQNPPHQNQPYV